MKWSNITLAWFIINLILLERNVNIIENKIVLISFIASILNFALFLKSKTK